MNMNNYAVGFKEGLPISDQNSFRDQQVEIPAMSPTDVLVKVKAVSINPVDTKLRQATARQKELRILGFDGVGEVVAKGEAVKKFKIGDMIFYAGTTKRAGSNQQYQAVDERIAAKAPTNLSIEDCAAIPLTALTAYELLFEKFKLIPKENANKGKSILVINGAGGVGSILNQLAHWAGLTVLSTSSPKNFTWLKEMAVDYSIDYHQPIMEQIQAIGMKSVDYIASLYDISPYFDLIVEIISPFGQVGTIVEVNKELPMNLLKNKSVSFHWEYMFTKTDTGYQVGSQGKILAEIAMLFNEKKLKSTLTKAYTKGINAENMKKATAAVEAAQGNGKIVVSGPFNSTVSPE